ncbi:hypothetical protein [Flavobacterium marginilacus]|uniref:hypothetical protein n=1 Tax=Flavobacterium marginilacus TaxID=3003256 RepID=UPI00248DA1E6|nr:hypothetical protein [Flavobacterium marginilacus]
MKPIYYTFLAAVITITSCKNNDEEKDKSIPKVITPFTQQTAVTAQTSQQTAPQQHNLFHENNAVGTPSVAAGVNPAHGQPNHRCDIPVGAPLNSPVNGTAAPQTNQVPMQPQVQTITQSVVKTPRGMNPPHGQPNHRCDIPVGAPLNSKPAATASTAVTPAPASGVVSKNITVQPPVPELLSTSSTNVETADGMNPPHGKPGHRCDIAVGAPLPKS